MALVFQADRQQLQHVLMNAYNASLPKYFSDEAFVDIHEIDYFEKFITTSPFNHKEFVDLVELHGRAVNLHIEEIDTFDNFKHWIIYEDTFNDLTTTCGKVYTPQKLVESVDCVIVSQYQLQELPATIKMKRFLLVFVDDKCKSFMLDNLNQGNEIIDSVKNELDFSGGTSYEYDKTTEFTEFKYDNVKLVICYGFVAVNYVDAQTLTDSRNYTHVENFKFVMEELNDTNI